MNSKERNYVEKTLKSYEDKSVTKLDELRALDKKVKKGVSVFAYVFGSVGSLIMGLGMCMAMEVILPGLMFLGIVIGLIGIFMVSINYYVYQKMLANSKRKYASQIKQLSAELLNE